MTQLEWKLLIEKASWGFLVLLVVIYALLMCAPLSKVHALSWQVYSLFAPQSEHSQPGDATRRRASPADLSPEQMWQTSSTVTVTVHATVVGTTTTYIGATEAAGFWIDDLTNLGVNTYRLWTKMAELEWWDDDDAMDGLWDDSEYGTPTMTEIRADVAYSFTNTIPWTWWDTRFDEVQSWRYGVQTRRGIIEALVQDGVTPLVVLRTYDDQGQPEQRPGAQWAPQPPVDDDFRNEWWEHCFALAYWLNVRNDYGITHFEVLNEPDYSGQGWDEYGGTTADHVRLALGAHDAISYANSFAGLPTYIHAPVVANYNSTYVTYVLDNADTAVQVVDYHTYADDVRPSIIGIRSTISSHNPDGVLEPIWNSEWGALWSSYDTFDRAMLTANQLLTFSEEQVEGVTIFNMYDWSTAAGQDYGLVDLQDDGMGGVQRVPTESYYAFRLMTRGLIGGKEQLAATTIGLGPDSRVMATRDDAHLYVILLQDDVGAPITATIDLSELGIGFGTATIYEYSAARKDEVVASPTLAAGVLTFTAPADGISLAVVPRPDLSASTKLASAATVCPGEPLTYTLVLSNTSAVGPASARLTDTLPTYTTFAAGPWASSGQAGYAGGVITWTGAVSVSTPTTVTYRVTVALPLDDDTVISNTALLDDGEGAQVEVGPATATISSAPDLAGSVKAVEPLTVTPGAALIYTLLLTNTGTMDASMAWLTDTLPLSTTYAAGPWASSGQAGHAGGVITWTGAVSVSTPITVTYRVTVAHSLSNGTVITNTALIHDGTGGQWVTPTAVAVVQWRHLYLPLVLHNWKANVFPWSRSVPCCP